MRMWIVIGGDVSGGRSDSGSTGDRVALDDEEAVEDIRRCGAYVDEEEEKIEEREYDEYERGERRKEMLEVDAKVPTTG